MKEGHTMYESRKEARKARQRQLKPWARKAVNLVNRFGEAALMAFMGIGTACIIAQFLGVMLGVIDGR